MQDNGSESPLGGQGSQDFSSLIGTPATTQSAPAAPATVPGAPAITQPTTPKVPLSQTTGVEPQGEQSAGEAPATETSEGQPAAPATGQSATPPPTDLNAANRDLVAVAVEAGIRASREHSQQSQQQPVQPARLSDQEFQQKYNIPTVTPQHMAAILDADPVRGAAAMNQLIGQAIYAALHMSSDVARAQAEVVRNEHAPHITAWQQHQAEIREQKALQQFQTKYPDLKDEMALVNEVKDAFIARVRAGQVKFNTTEEALEAVAKTSRGLLARIRPGSSAGTNGAPSNGTQPAGQQAPRQMSAALSAGRPGSSNAPAAAKSPVEEVFGADAR